MDRPNTFHRHRPSLWRGLELILSIFITCTGWSSNVINQCKELIVIIRPDATVPIEVCSGDLVIRTVINPSLLSAHGQGYGGMREVSSQKFFIDS